MHSVPPFVLAVHQLVKAKAAFQYEMKMMPVTWEAKRRCIEFWLTVLRISDDRLVKRVMMESLEMVGKTAWQKDLECGLEGFDWRDVGIEGLGRLSMTEIGHMLRNTAQREVTNEVGGNAWSAGN